MLEVIYLQTNAMQVEQTHFESTDKYLEWKENNPDIKILEILEENL